MIFARRFWGFWIVAAVVVLVGLFVGQWRQDDKIRGYYKKVDFSLLDDKGEIFQLKEFPADRLLLLVFTPDDLLPAHVRPFSDFVKGIPQLGKKNMEVIVVTRTHREIARNFLRASGYSGRLLHDLGGTVGGKVGVWDGFKTSQKWGYALLDRTFSLHWMDRRDTPETTDWLLGKLDELARLSATGSTTGAAAAETR